MQFKPALIAIFLLQSLPAIAQEEHEWQSWPLVDHFTISLNAMFPHLDTRVRLDATDESPGTVIIFEQNLGMSDTETLPALVLGWRFAKKHTLGLNTLNLDRSGSTVTTSEISIGDEVFTIDLPVSSFIDMTITGIEYSYSLILDERKELALGVGLSVQDISFGLTGNLTAGIVEVGSDVTAPVPTFLIKGGYAFTDKWLGKMGVGFLSFDLALESDDQLGGDVFSGYVAIQHNTFEHVHFALSYQLFDVQIDWIKDGLYTSVGYEYNGPVLSVTAAF
ncbi:MAG: hypothetical protein ACI88G_002090 [Woeseiaceae bacterium]|jgi:hypothetical protein